MKTKTFAILSTVFAITLITTTVIYAHVVDLEFIGPSERYDLDPHKEGRDFYDWINDQSRKEEARDRWFKDAVNEVAFEVAASFDPRLGERD